jgi:hypothetical protein
VAAASVIVIAQRVAMSDDDPCYVRIGLLRQFLKYPTQRFKDTTLATFLCPPFTSFCHNTQRRPHKGKRLPRCLPWQLFLLSSSTSSSS